MHHMKKNLLLFIFLTMMTNLSAQECEYNEYYSLVNSAFKNYSEKNYKEAENNLKLAFNKTNFPLGKDLELALSVAQKRDNSQWAEEIAIKLAKGGVPLRYFVKLNNFGWYKNFTMDFENYSNYYNENFKPELRENLNSLIDRDAKFVRKLMDWHYHMVEITAQEAINEATAIQSELKKLTEKFGFPREQTMGYNYVRRLNRVEVYKTDVLMIHLYKYGELIYENDIPNLICNGIFYPNFQQMLKQSRGFGNSTGIEQEMELRYEKYKVK